MAKVAFIGLGVMGYPMARHLAQKGGHELTVYNRTGAKAEKWVTEDGGRNAGSEFAHAAAGDVYPYCNLRLLDASNRCSPCIHAPS